VGGQTCTPLVPDVMLNLVVMLYQPPTKIALLNETVSPNQRPVAGSRVVGLPVVSQ
jgi:hypothetical protein